MNFAFSLLLITAIALPAGRAGGLGRRAGWHASARGAAGPAAGDTGAAPVGGARVKSGFVFPIRPTG